MDAGENIKKLRVEAGYTQKQLAGIMGVKAPYISALERGQRRPGKKILPLLCDALGVDEMTILFGPRKGPLSYEERVVLAAIAGLTGAAFRAVIRFIMELKASGAWAGTEDPPRPGGRMKPSLVHTM